MRGILTTLLEVTSILALVGFAWLCWPPAALGVAGGSGLVVSWRLSGGTLRRKP